MKIKQVMMTMITNTLMTTKMTTMTVVTETIMITTRIMMMTRAMMATITKRRRRKTGSENNLYPKRNHSS